MGSSIFDDIRRYYDLRKLRWPSPEDAMKFFFTEIAELFEHQLASQGYVRNNPQNKPSAGDLDGEKKEYLDALMMFLVYGMTKGYFDDPIAELREKLLVKLSQLGLQ